MNHLFCISGFTQQRWGKAKDSGTIQLYGILRMAIATSLHDTDTHCLEWHDDPRGYARMVARDHKGGDKIMICVYSYGGGWWLMEFLDELAKYGIKVDVVVACDPVYRSKYFFLRWKALTKQTLELPENVIRRYVHFVQYLNKPGGDAIYVPADIDYHGPHELQYKHVKMDNAPEYHERAKVEAIRLFAGYSE